MSFSGWGRGTANIANSPCQGHCLTWVFEMEKRPSSSTSVPRSVLGVFHDLLSAVDLWDGLEALELLA